MERVRAGRSDVVVVGGGVVGLACARELALRGASVRLLERGRVGQGCSFGNAGWLTPSLAMPLAVPGQWKKALRWLLDAESPFYIRPRADPGLVTWLIRFLAASRPARFERGAAALVAMCRFSVDAWEELAADPVSEPFGFARAGLLAVYESTAGLAAGRASARLVERFGVPHEEWSVEQVRAREPALLGSLVGGLFYPRDAQCEPYPAVRALATAARRAGVVIDEDCEVLAAELDVDLVRGLRTSRGRVEAGEVVLAAGVWSGALARQLGLRLPMLGAKGYAVVVPRREPHPRQAIYLAERKVAINPHQEALRIAGTLELVGEDLSIDFRRLGAIVRAAGGMLALPEPLAEREVWRGLRPCLPDGMPAIGRARGRRNLWLATGHQMTGLKAAPGTARLLAELMAGESPSFDPEPFRADRYG